MLPRKSRQKSPSTSSVDSGLGHSIKKRLTDKSAMNREVNYSQQLLQAASLTTKTQLLKRGLMNSNEKVQGFMNKISPAKKSESCSDFEYINTLSQFSPLACSSQQVVKSESTSESSGDDEQFTTERTLRVIRTSSTDSEEELSNLNEVNISSKSASKTKSKTISRKKSKINILDNQLILSDSKEEVDSDSKSVVAIHKSISSYSVSSEFDSEEEEQELQSESKTSNNESLNTIKAHHSDSVLKSIQRDESTDSDSSNSGKSHSCSVTLKSNYSEDRTNKTRASTESNDLQNIVRTSNADRRSVKTLQKQVNNYGSQKKSSLQLNDISSTESENSEKQSHDESDLGGSTELKSKHKVLDETTILLKNILNENKDYKTLSIPQKADLMDIDSEDEIYLLQIPKSINPKIMKGVSFSLNKKSKLKIESSKYLIKRRSDCSSLLIYSNSLKIMRPLASLKMEKNLKVKEQDEIVVEERKRQPLPSNIKVRHPLFGSDYKSKIELDVQIKEKLEQALQRFQVKKKTPKRKKKLEEDEEDKNHLISKILEEKFGNVSRSTTKSERIQSSSPNRSLEISGVKTELFHGKKETIDNARNKKKADIPFHVGSFENSNDLETIIKSEVQESLYLPNILVDGNHPKKKKKRKHFQEPQELANQVKSPLVDSNKIKKERNEVEEETFIEQEIKSESNNRSKGKKNKNISEEDISIDEQFVNDFSQESLNRKKEKKRSHKKTEMLDNKLETDLKMERNELNLMNSLKCSELEKEDMGAIVDVISREKNKNKRNAIKKEYCSHDEFESVEIPLKKKMKKKQIELEYSLAELSVKKEPSEEYPIQSPKKRRKSVLSSTRIFENLDTSDFKVDLSGIESEESIAKRKKNFSHIHDNDVNNDLINSLLFSVKNRLESKSDKNKVSKRKTS